ncbi:hypothetical protein MLD38_007077 [Melastoma candidum]|uniref:Uncharacterized protein n=1 Tax=Melastoma candidum TaxID=119954 RepID=A0ACB9RPX2_9MYRT|nr:hypothetical protein MLD38_007077 [Melastoma candidum]
MNRPGDWTCRSCHRMNFQRRESCQRCGGPRTMERVGGGGGGDFLNFVGRPPAIVAPPSPFRMTVPGVRPGDWYCAIGNCGTHNFANRTTCFRCGALREEVNTEGGAFESEVHQWMGTGMGGGVSNNRPGWRAGDWICTRLGCNEHNFANRTECFRCNAPRDQIAGLRFLPE